MTSNPKGYFGNWLYGELLDKHVEIKEFAECIGLSRQIISGHINGRRRPHRSTLRMYADYFNVDYWMLYDMIIRDYS